MPAKDKFHEAVVRALIKDGWTITDEEVFLSFARRSTYVDILAERPLTAEREGKKIAVEVKTFGSAAKMSELEKALGQFLIYKTALTLANMEHELYLAVPLDIGEFLQLPDTTKLRHDFGIKAVSYDAQKEIIVQWIE